MGDLERIAGAVGAIVLFCVFFIMMIVDNLDNGKK